MGFARHCVGTTLSRRLAILILAVSTVTGLLASGFSIFLTHRVLLQAVDHELSVVMHHGPRDGAAVADQLPSGSIVLADDGRRQRFFYTSESSGAPRGDQAVLKRLIDELSTQPRTVDLSGDRQVRVRVVPTARGKVLAAYTLAEMQRSVWRLAALQTVAWLIAAGFASLAGIAVSRRITRPLEDVTRAANEVASTFVEDVGSALGKRLQDDPKDLHEVCELKQSVNALLGQVDAAMTQRTESDAALREFLADVSHDLRTPIAVVRSHADVANRAMQRCLVALQEVWPHPGEQLDLDLTEQRIRGIERELVALQPFGSQLAQSISRMSQESRRMGEMVDDLLTLARLNSIHRPDPEEVDLTYQVLELVSDAKTLTPTHHWSVDVGPDPITIIGDEAGVRRVLTNLISNAGKHTPAGTRVTVGLRQEDEKAVLTVADDGPGIPQSVIDRANRFEHRDRGNRGSTGLGLVISRGLARQMGGDVEFASNAEGTLVTIVLPLVFDPTRVEDALVTMNRLTRRNTPR